ncbi:MAG TPA: hypothetical protein VFF70_01920 [Anaerolineae bacterium]|nr:hypothetical protein [Anaerolineae bacterium]
MFKLRRRSQTQHRSIKSSLEISCPIGPAGSIEFREIYSGGVPFGKLAALGAAVF